MALAVCPGMPDPLLTDRVAILETKMERVDSFVEEFDKMLEARFRAQAEMMDRRFVDVLRQMDRRFVEVLGEMREGIVTLLQRFP